MNRLQRAAVLLTSADALRDTGSWCGETHLQKTTYFLQDLLKVPTDFTFILYNHGPFSFDLRDELTALRADGFLEIRPQLPYGPSLVTTSAGHALEEEYPKTVKKYDRAVEFVAKNLGDKNVSELERLATALFITLEDQHESVRDRAKEIHDLKPHVSLESAILAAKDVDSITEAAKKL